MNREENWNERYIKDDLPWDTGRSDFNLREILEKNRIHPCKALELGCGTGSNAIWLSRRGFSVTAIDISEAAIQLAIKKASKAGVKCRFLKLDFMKQEVGRGPFGFVFDRGCFHSLDSARERSKYARLTHSYLNKGGLWLTLVGSADEPPRYSGPPQLTANDLISTVEPYFKILLLYANHFDSMMRKPPRAWICLMQKRKKEVGHRGRSSRGHTSRSHPPGGHWSVPRCSVPKNPP